MHNLSVYSLSMQSKLTVTLGFGEQTIKECSDYVAGCTDALGAFEPYSKGTVPSRKRISALPSAIAVNAKIAANDRVGTPDKAARWLTKPINGISSALKIECIHL